MLTPNCLATSFCNSPILRRFFLTCSPRVFGSKSYGFGINVLSETRANGKKATQRKKHDGSLPLVGVNTFLGEEGKHIHIGEQELMRSTEEEKVQQVGNVEAFRGFHQTEAEPLLNKLQQSARDRKNTIDALMEAGKCCSLGSMSHALYEVGGGYRRNM